MTTAPKSRPARKPADVITLSFERDHAERLVSAFEKQADAQCKANEHLAYAAEKVGEVANGFLGTGKFLQKWGGYILALALLAAQVIFPTLKNIIDKLPPLPN